MQECKNRAPGSLEWKDEEGERKGFEKWADDEYTLYKYSDGSYCSPVTRAALHGYQSRQPEIDMFQQLLNWENRTNDLLVAKVKELEAKNKQMQKRGQDSLDLLTWLARLCGVNDDEATIIEIMRTEIASMVGWPHAFQRRCCRGFDVLKAEVAHWKSNHDNMVERSRVLIDRPDLPLERVKAFKQLETLKAENEKMAIDWLNQECTVQKLQAENEKLRKDAERYRWLRDPCVDIRPIVKYQRGLTHQSLDAAIDAAMTAPDTKGE